MPLLGRSSQDMLEPSKPSPMSPTFNFLVAKTFLQGETQEMQQRASRISKLQALCNKTAMTVQELKNEVRENNFEVSQTTNAQSRTTTTYARKPPAQPNLGITPLDLVTTGINLLYATSKVDSNQEPPETDMLDPLLLTPPKSPKVIGDLKMMSRARPRLHSAVQRKVKRNFGKHTGSLPEISRQRRIQSAIPGNQQRFEKSESGINSQFLRNIFRPKSTETKLTTQQIQVLSNLIESKLTKEPNQVFQSATLRKLIGHTIKTFLHDKQDGEKARSQERPERPEIPELPIHKIQRPLDSPLLKQPTNAGINIQDLDQEEETMRSARKPQVSFRLVKSKTDFIKPSTFQIDTPEPSEPAQQEEGKESQKEENQTQSTHSIVAKDYETPVAYLPYKELHRSPDPKDWRPVLTEKVRPRRLQFKQETKNADRIFDQIYHADFPKFRQLLLEEKVAKERKKREQTNEFKKQKVIIVEPPSAEAGKESNHGLSQRRSQRSHRQEMKKYKSQLVKASPRGGLTNRSNLSNQLAQEGSSQNRSQTKKNLSVSSFAGTPKSHRSNRRQKRESSLIKRIEKKILKKLSALDADGLLPLSKKLSRANTKRLTNQIGKIVSSSLKKSKTKRPSLPSSRLGDDFGIPQTNITIKRATHLESSREEIKEPSGPSLFELCEQRIENEIKRQVDLQRHGIEKQVKEVIRKRRNLEAAEEAFKFVNMDDDLKTLDFLTAEDTDALIKGDLMALDDEQYGYQLSHGAHIAGKFWASERLIKAPQDGLRRTKSLEKEPWTLRDDRQIGKFEWLDEGGDFYAMKGFEAEQASCFNNHLSTKTKLFEGVRREICAEKILEFPYFWTRKIADHYNAELKMQSKWQVEEEQKINQLEQKILSEMEGIEVYNLIGAKHSLKRETITQLEQDEELSPTAWCKQQKHKHKKFFKSTLLDVRQIPFCRDLPVLTEWKLKCIDQDALMFKCLKPLNEEPSSSNSPSCSVQFTKIETLDPSDNLLWILHFDEQLAVAMSHVLNTPFAPYGILENLRMETNIAFLARFEPFLTSIKGKRHRHVEIKFRPKSSKVTQGMLDFFGHYVVRSHQSQSKVAVHFQTAHNSRCTTRDNLLSYGDIFRPQREVLSFQETQLLKHSLQIGTLSFLKNELAMQPYIEQPCLSASQVLYRKSDLAQYKANCRAVLKEVVGVVRMAGERYQSEDSSDVGGEEDPESNKSTPLFHEYKSTSIDLNPHEIDKDGRRVHIIQKNDAVHSLFKVPIRQYYNFTHVADFAIKPVNMADGHVHWIFYDLIVPSRNLPFVLSVQDALRALISRKLLEIETNGARTPEEQRQCTEQASQANCKPKENTAPTAELDLLKIPSGYSSQQDSDSSQSCSVSQGQASQRSGKSCRSCGRSINSAMSGQSKRSKSSRNSKASKRSGMSKTSKLSSKMKRHKSHFDPRSKKSSLNLPANMAKAKSQERYAKSPYRVLQTPNQKQRVTRASSANPIIHKSLVQISNTKDSKRSRADQAQDFCEASVAQFEQFEVAQRQTSETKLILSEPLLKLPSKPQLSLKIMQESVKSSSEMVPNDQKAQESTSMISESLITTPEGSTLLKQLKNQRQLSAKELMKSLTKLSAHDQSCFKIKQASKVKRSPKSQLGERSRSSMRSPVKSSEIFKRRLSSFDSASSSSGVASSPKAERVNRLKRIMDGKRKREEAKEVKQRELSLKKRAKKKAKSPKGKAKQIIRQLKKTKDGKPPTHMQLQEEMRQKPSSKFDLSSSRPSLGAQLGKNKFFKRNPSSDSTPGIRQYPKFISKQTLKYHKLITSQPNSDL